MQNSFWKLISAVGVAAIGTLVVLEVQDKLPKQGAALHSSDETIPPGDTERVITAPTDQSEFEQHANQVDLGAIGAQTASADGVPAFDAMLQEPDVNSASASRQELTDNRDPFAADTDFGSDQFTPNPFGNVEDESTSVQSVGYSEEPEPTPVDDGSFLEFATRSDPGSDTSSNRPDDGDFVVVPVGNEVPQPEAVDVPFPDDAPTDDAGFSDPFSNEMAPEDIGADGLTADDQFSERSASDQDRLLFFPEGGHRDSSTESDRTPSPGRGERVTAARDEPFASDSPQPAPELRRLDDTGNAFGRDLDLRATPEAGARDLPAFDERREADPRLAIDTATEPAATEEPDLMMFGEEEDGDSDPLPFDTDFTPVEERDDAEPRLPADRSRLRDRSPLPDRSLIPDEGDSVPVRPPRNTPDSRDSEFPDFSLPEGDREFSDEPDFGDDSRFSDDRFEPRDRRQPDSADDSGPFRQLPADDTEARDNEFPELNIRPRGRRDSFDPSDFDSEFNLDRRREADETETTDESSASSSGTLRPHLTVSKQMPDSATLGVPLTYTLVVTNEGASAASDVIIEDVVPTAARVDQADPPADYDKETRKLIWEFAELQAGESRELRVQLTPVERGRLNSVATVRFKAHVVTSTVVQAPQLKVVLDIPREVKVGSEVKLRYIVTNSGDGAATDVMLRSDLPPGLRNPIGNDLEYNIDTMQPGEEREVELDVVAAEPGEFISTAEILAAGMAPQSTESSMRIIGQQIQVVRSGPQRRYVGRPAVYENILTNETSFDASEIRVVERVPEGMRFDKASHQGVYNPEKRLVTWDVNQIGPGETETLKIRLVAETVGDQESSVTVIENAGFETAARHTTAVEDLHNIGMRMSVLNGPVPVGREFGFDIVVQNRGTADATGVRLTIDVPDGVMGVSVGKGGPKATPSIESGHLQYHFDPLEKIESGQEMNFRINFKATRAISNGIVNARISYDQMQNELVTSEAVTASDEAP